MRPRTLLALLLVVPLADALFLVFVATRLGWTLTVALVVLTAILGMLLLRAEGRATLARVQRKLARGDPPTDELLDGGLLIASGAFLLTPGLVTDALGFLLALPITRVPIRLGVKRYVVVPYIDSQTDGFASGSVYVGGFPDGDGGGGLGGGVGGPGTGPSAPEEGGRDEGSDDDVVDVEYTVEDGEDRSSDRHR
jgi:UPF0716 protein FxsA